MGTITKGFLSRKKAAQFQDKLYDKYYRVQLVKSPLFSESGEYVWKVSEELSEDEQDDIWLDRHGDRTPT